MKNDGISRGSGGLNGRVTWEPAFEDKEGVDMHKSAPGESSLDRSMEAERKGTEGKQHGVEPLFLWEPLNTQSPKLCPPQVSVYLVHPPFTQVLQGSLLRHFS